MTENDIISRFNAEPVAEQAKNVSNLWDWYAGVYFARLPVPLVLSGGPGTGKSTAMLSLALDIMLSRQAGERVPVLLDFPTLGASSERFSTFLIRMLERDFAWLANTGRGKHGLARRLLESGHLAFFIDGMDEVSIAGRTNIFRELRELDPTAPIVVTTRPQAYAEARAAGAFTPAIVINIDNIGAAEIASNLIGGHDNQQVRARFAQLARIVATEPNGNLAKGLGNPLAINLVRDAYSHPGSDPLVLTECRSVAEIHDAFFEHFFWTRYSDDRERRRAVSALSFLAYNMRDRLDLAYWQISPWLIGRISLYRQCVVAFVFASFGILGFMRPSHTVAWVFSVAVAAVLGATLSMILTQDVVPSTSRMRLPRSAAEFGRVARAAAELSSVCGLGAGILAYLNAGWAVGLAVALLFAASGALAGVTAGYLDLCSVPISALAEIGPWQQYATDRGRRWLRAALSGAAVAVGSAIFEGVILGLGDQLRDPEGLGVAAVYSCFIGIIFTVLFSLFGSATADLRFAEWVSRDLNNNPKVRFIPLLQRAHEVSILRQEGPFYRFRHLALQEFLCRRYSSSLQRARSKRTVHAASASQERQELL